MFNREYPFDLSGDFEIPKELNVIGEEGLSAILSKMNDQSSSFEEIANWIENNVEFY